MSSSSPTVDLDTLNFLTPTHNCEPVRLDQEHKQSNVNGQNILDKEIISSTETQELRRLEAIVDRGLRAFWEIGQALRQIQAQRLYRQHYKNFEEYCITRWEMSRRSAYQLIEAASVYENVRHGAQILPANERQARPLTVLPPEKQQEAWNKAVSTAPCGKVTSVHVAQVAKEYQQNSTVTKSRNKKTPEQESNLTASITPSGWNCSSQENFTLTLQLPPYLKPLIQDTANESGLGVVDWVTKLLQEAVLKTEISQSTQIHEDIGCIPIGEINYCQ
ncbi:MAG: hypothetical protein HC908_09110 [Calothrix sp. SM1_7_51]|nr:hypothetical protein [Calothrix sp. SM1_7_51]